MKYWPDINAISDFGHAGAPEPGILSNRSLLVTNGRAICRTPAAGVSGVPTRRFAVTEDLLLGRPQPVPASTSGCSHGIKEAALGAHPVRGKGRAHPPYDIFEGHEPSFSLIRADSRHILKGDSHVSQSAGGPPASTATQC